MNMKYMSHVEAESEQAAGVSNVMKGDEEAEESREGLNNNG